MKDIHWLLDKYGESHLNATNKIIHWICVPSIIFSLIGLLKSIPFFVERDFSELGWPGIGASPYLLFEIIYTHVPGVLPGSYPHSMG